MRIKITTWSQKPKKKKKKKVVLSTPQLGILGIVNFGIQSGLGGIGVNSLE